MRAPIMAEAAPAPPAVLEVKNLSGGYDDTPVLNGVTLAIRGGEILAVLGRNGMGKTTFEGG
jgi:ABC-type multidrug transport system ATPase subunit